VKEEIYHESRKVYQCAILQAQQEGRKTESFALQQEYKQMFNEELPNPLPGEGKPKHD
jgi:hypothetical protein